MGLVMYLPCTARQITVARFAIAKSTRELWRDNGRDLS